MFHSLTSHTRRVGFTQQLDHPKVNLPVIHANMEEKWEVTESVRSAPLWDFMWNVWADESREKSLLKDAFVIDVDHMPWHDPPSSDGVRVAESALKVRVACLFFIFLPN